MAQNDPAKTRLSEAANDFVDRRDDRRIALALILIFAAGFAFRMWGLLNSLLDFHAWRQTLTAMVARNFLRDGMSIIAPRLDDLQPHFEFEFQVFPYLRGPRLPVLRYQGMAWAARCGPLRHGDDEVPLRPRQRIPESCGCPGGGWPVRCPAHGSVLYLDVHARIRAAVLIRGRCFPLGKVGRPSKRDGWLAALWFALAVGIKATALYLVLPALWLSKAHLGWKGFRDIRLELLLVLGFVAPLLWYGYIGSKAQTGLKGGVWLRNDKPVGFEYLLRPKFYRLIFLTRLGEKMFAFSAYSLVLAGAVLALR